MSLSCDFEDDRMVKMLSFASLLGFVLMQENLFVCLSSAWYR